MALPVYCRTLDSKYDVYMASRHIDTLTFNRILYKGWDNLSPYQKDIIEKVCENQAIFELENKDILESAISNYSINGVTMTLNLNDSAIKVENGVMMKRADYELLKTTGLCCRVI